MKIKLQILFFVCLIGFFSTCTTGSQQKKGPDSPILDIAYSEKSLLNKLDIFFPDNGIAPYPVVIGIHGGAFRAGNKESESFIFKKALDRGYAVVCIGYRLSGEAIFPAAIHDVKAAIRWVKANGQKYNLNTDKIGLWGASAGAHLSALAATSAQDPELTDLSLGNPEYSSDVQVVIDWYGPTNFINMDKQLAESGIVPDVEDHDDPESPESQFLGAPIQTIPEIVRAANPETYINDKTPPFFIQHGTNDEYVPYQQSVKFAGKLIDVIGAESVQLDVLKGEGHGTDGFFTEENYKKSLDFLDKYLK